MGNRSTYVTERVDAARATINMVHNKTSLTISREEAARFEEEAKQRLIASKKLSLVVDLDQTVIQACVEPTVGEWMKNPENPNHEAVKDVREFQLVEDAAGTKGCWYYIKLRPGLEEFLERMSKLYEMHIYTMGTRGYAQKIAQIIDPERKFFGDRILSRDESGSLVAKNLQRLFPVDTKMVLIIDDRGDVWKWNDNLIKVTPYDFFVGIGDINSSFLPKKPGFTSPAGTAFSDPPPGQNIAGSLSVQDDEPKINGIDRSSEDKVSVHVLDPSSSSDTSALEQLVSMGGGDDPLTLQEQTSRQDETLAAQLEDRPLLKKQLQLEEEDAAAAKASSASEVGEKVLDPSPDDSNAEKPRHHILEDHDRQLEYLEQSLRRVHAEYFESHARQIAAKQGGRIAELRGSKRKQPIPSMSDLVSVPDVKTIMPSIKRLVLGDVIMVFSGVVPLGWDTQSSDLAMWAKSFGAKVEESITEYTTHLIAARNRTVKVRQALNKGKGKTKIVSPLWLVGSLAQWTKLDETPYLLDIDDSESSQAKNGTTKEDEILSDSEDVVNGFESEEEDHSRPRSTKAKPALSIAIGEEEESDLDGLLPDDLEDQQSPVGGTNEDWDDMNAELNEFLGSEAEESDGEGSVGSAESTKSSRSAMARRPKRVREVDDSGQESGARKKTAPSRPTNLSQIAVPTQSPADSRETSPAKEGGDDDSVGDLGDAPDDEDGEGGRDWTDFEQDLAAEMEKSEAEELDQG